MGEGEPTIREEMADEDSVDTSGSQSSSQEIPADQISHASTPVEGGMSSGGESSGAQSQAETAKSRGQKASASPRPSTAERQVSIEEEIAAAREMVDAAADEINIIGGPTGSK